MNEIDKEVKLAEIVNMVNESDISSIKSVVSSIIKIISDTASTAKDLKEVIQIDPPLTAKVLKLANSAYYSRRSKISDIEHAVIWVGYDAVKELALSQKVCEIFDKDESVQGYSRYQLWQNSVGVALLGKMIYRREFGEKGEDIYAAGLLRNIGIIAIDQFRQQEFVQCLQIAKTESLNLIDVENRILGYNHAEVGLAITRNWQLPEELVASIGLHHQPDKVEQAYMKKMVYTLYLADSLGQDNRVGYCDAPKTRDDMFNLCRKELNIGPYAFDYIISDMKKELKLMQIQGVF